VTMAPKPQVLSPSRKIGTRASNKTAHPGQIAKPSATRRTSAEVQQERDAKAQDKADLEEARKKGIVRTAEFERAEMANADMVDATPRPSFTANPWPPPRTSKKTKLVPVTESSEDDIYDDPPPPPDFDETLTPVPSDVSAAEDSDESVSSPTPPPPTKKRKIKEATRTVPKASAKVTKKKGKVEKGKKVAVASDEEETPKPKKVKAKLREEITSTAKKMENKVKANKPPSQLEVEAGGGGKKLKREGAIADINAFYNKVTGTGPDQNVSSENNNDLMDIDKR
jgi:hypothetical protein